MGTVSALTHNAPGLYGPPDDDDFVAERTEELLAEFRGNPSKVIEADENWSGTLDGDHYSEIESALADLHGIAADRLIGSDALVRVLRLAKACADARDAALRDMAHDAAESEVRAMEYDRGDDMAWAREDAA